MACGHDCISGGSRNLPKPDPEAGEISSLLGGAVFQEGEANPHCFYSLFTHLSFSHRYEHKVRGTQHSGIIKVPVFWMQDENGQPQRTGNN